MPSSIGKHLERIVTRSRLDRFFVGIFTNPAMESWHEMGHFAQGVDIKLTRLNEKNGSDQFTGNWLGAKIEGSFEPGQNEIEDYTFYEQWMNGIRSVAVLTKGSQLWLFRLKKTGPKSTEDNRISLMTHPVYADTMRKGAGEISGFIKNYEFIRVKDFQFIESTGKLKYTTLKTFTPSGLYAGIGPIKDKGGK
jgi:hypothetical protein